MGAAFATSNATSGQTMESVTIYNTQYQYLYWPTWTTSDQSDMTWDWTYSNSGTHMYIVQKSAHGNRTGTYSIGVWTYVNGSPGTGLSDGAYIELTF